MMKRRFVKLSGIWILVLCMLMTMIPVPAYADEEIADNTSTENEIGTESIYFIESKDDLLELEKQCRVDTWSVNVKIILMTDIDLTGSDFAGIPTFAGVFSGRGHTIKGLNLTGAGSVVGFFRYLQEGAIVSDLKIEGTIQPSGSKSTVGGFAGVNAGTIRDCSFQGTVTGYEQIGGFVGLNETSGIIEDCEINGMVYGSHFIGGIAGENHGTIQSCRNNAEINTQAIQNSIDIEDITLENMMNTESINTATDIGGIAGTNSGVIRACRNNGLVGYQSMGYNVGGIAGSQKGYIVDSINRAKIQGRKEVGGIVGHMEPNLVLDYQVDSFQTLSAQLQELSVVLQDLRKTIETSSKKIEKEMDALEKDIHTIESSMETVEKELDNELTDIDIGKIVTSFSEMSTAMSDATKRISNLQKLLSDFSDETGEKLENAITKMDEVMETIEHIEDDLDFSITDVSDEDTEADTLGKVAGCMNYGTIIGERNIGGIAGIMADETDLDAYEDIAISGEISLNGQYRMRVVIRDCKNFGTISASKQYVGGIAGQMIIGAILECTNLGNMDALRADYVGGICGKGYSVIRQCQVKSILAGDTYVGGIAGEGDEVTDSYAFVSIVAFTEKAGAIIGSTDSLPTGAEDDVVLRNYYFLDGQVVGGIDGISYAGAAEQVDLDGFLQLQELEELLRKVTIHFYVDGQEIQQITIDVGTSLEEGAIPVLKVEQKEEYSWKIIPQVTDKILGMGEIASSEYISKEAITNILFDQSYEVEYDLKSTVIQGLKENESNRATILAEGIFAKNTNVQIIDTTMETVIYEEDLLESQKVSLSNPGVAVLHYLIPEEINAAYVKLYIKNMDGEWETRDFVVDGSYMVFPFTDKDTEFALVSDYSGLIQMVAMIGIIAAGFIWIALTVFFVKMHRKKRFQKHVKA